MPLQKPNLPRVSPGDPITADMWNQMRDAVLLLYDLIGTPRVPDIAVSVVDSASNDALSGVTVTAFLESDPTQTWTGTEQGTSYTFLNLPAGTYTVKVVKIGYVDATRTGVVVASDQPANLTVSLVRIPDKVIVPDVTGKLLPDAINALLAAGILLDQTLTNFGTVIFEGQGPVPQNYQQSPVIEQQPAAGLEVDDTVKAVLRVEAVVPMPDLAGKTVGLALSDLTGYGLTVVEIMDAYGHTYEPSSLPSLYQGAALSQQSPAPGTLTRVSQKVTLTADVTQIPTVADVALDSVRTATLSGARLKLGGVFNVSGTALSSADITGLYLKAPVVQIKNYTAGQIVLPDTTVDLVVKVMAYVPQINGQTYSQYKTALTNAGLAVGPVYNEDNTQLSATDLNGWYLNAPVKALRNYSQGAAVPVSTAVSLTVAVMVQVPSVVGNALDTARTSISNARLAVGSIFNDDGTQLTSTDYTDTGLYVKAPVSQIRNRTAGAVVPAGTVVDLQVNVMVSVPNFYDQKFSAAKTSVANAGLKLGTVKNADGSDLGTTYPGYPNPDNAFVNSQSLSSGAAVPRGSTCDLRIVAIVPAKSIDFATYHVKFGQDEWFGEAPYTTVYFSPLEGSRVKLGTVVDVIHEGDGKY